MGDVGVQHHPDITLNNTRSAPYHKGLAKRVMLVRSKNKNFLVEIFLYPMSELVQITSHFQLEKPFSLQGLASKLQAHEKKLQGHVLKICQIDFKPCCYSLRAQQKRCRCGMGPLVLNRKSTMDKFLRFLRPRILLVLELFL